MESTRLTLARMSCLALLTGCGSLVVDGNGEVIGDDTEATYEGDDPGGYVDAGSVHFQDGCTEYHAFGIYEATSDHSFMHHTTGYATVRIERPGRHVIALSSYEATDWTVETAAGVEIAGVLLLGYYDQNVVAPGDPPMTNLSTDYDYPVCGYSVPYNGGGCDTNELIAFEESWAAHSLTSFHGCYHATGFTLGADLSVTSTCDTGAGYETQGFVDDTSTCTYAPTPS